LTGAVPPGFVLAGRYALVRLIARGGMADVWEAKDTLLERNVAVKILHPHLAADAAFVARFRTEAIAAARLHHRSIVAIYDTCSDGGVEAIVMELAQGHTLREEIDRHGPLDPLVVINVGVDVADALQSAHAAGLIHRDIKPANILLCDDQRVMVTDFGIAKVRDNSDHTQTGTMLGSVKYVSPEQVEGNPVDPRSDVYSLGVVLYEALTAQPPFVADSPAATALARLHSTPPHPGQLRRDAPRMLCDVIVKAMAREPAARFSSATELRSALLNVRLTPHSDGDLTQVAPRPTLAATGATISAAAAPAPLAGAPSPRYEPPPQPAPAMAPRTPASSKWGPVILAALLIVLAIIVAAILISRTDSPGSVTDTSLRNGSSTTVSDNVASGSGVNLQAVASFDPAGDNKEGEATKGNATDGNPGTRWTTEYYRDQQMQTVPKPGVGLIVRTDKAAKLSRLKVITPSQDWSASVYLSDKQGAQLADWGDPVAKQESIQGDAEFDLGGRSGPFVLLWITRVTDKPECPRASDSARYCLQVGEITAMAP
jgi:serine/threonine protein kinase